MIALSSVPAWLIDGGIGHALASEDSSSVLRYTTACGIATNKGRVVEALPHSICGRCRNVLASAAINLKSKGTNES